MSDNPTGKYKLTADLISLDQPFMGLNMTVRAAVHYKLKEGGSEIILFKDTIETPFTATVSDAFIGVERLRLANEGAIKRNIRRLIENLNYLTKNKMKFKILDLCPNNRIIKNKEILLLFPLEEL